MGRCVAQQPLHVYMCINTYTAHACVYIHERFTEHKQILLMYYTCRNYFEFSLKNDGAWRSMGVVFRQRIVGRINRSNVTLNNNGAD